MQAAALHGREGFAVPCRLYVAECASCRRDVIYKFLACLFACAYELPMVFADAFQFDFAWFGGRRLDCLLAVWHAKFLVCRNPRV